MIVRMQLALAFTAMTLAILSPEVATAQGADCSGGSTSSAPKKKGIGLGSLMRGGGHGLLGSVMGAVRGEGDLKSDLAGAAASAAMRAGEQAFACAGQKAVAGASQASENATPTPRETSGAPGREERPAYPSGIAKPAAFAAMRDAYMQFGKDACKDCEGGVAYDGWAVFPRDEFSGKYDGDEQRMGSWPIGHVHRWKGNVSTGTLTVLAETEVQGFRCRTLRYRLEKSGASAERPGLLCWGRQNQFDGKDGWVKVY